MWFFQVFFFIYVDEGRIINDYIVFVSRVVVKYLFQLEFLFELLQKVLNYYMISNLLNFLMVYYFQKYIYFEYQMVYGYSFIDLIFKMLF